MNSDMPISDSKLARMTNGSISEAFGKASIRQEFDHFADLDLGASMEAVHATPSKAPHR